MHGRGGGEERKRARHMWTVPSRATAVVTGDGGASPSSSSSSTANFFCKDGRKISIGDCALFKPPQDSPPFIGIIRCLTTGKENKIKLGVNWLYRPAEVKLGKGILLDAAPNEIFYSFHKDEIPAASLLHPCKVAFLPKGTELPSGISSFVCRRVYDITNKCLWWLTDQDYINERQEEVDQLLYKTLLEMHVTVQPGGRSPKPINGPMQTSQLKPGSDSVQNSTSSFSSHAKGKKRERVDQGSDSVKRERTSKVDDGDSGHSRPEVSLKSEIAKITENGGLEDSEAVERLVQLMLPDRNEKKIDLVSRSMLASVIAATDKVDCLSQFVHLKGLPVFDEWLQEVHRGKVSDVGGSKENEKSIEEFLLILLRALDKLPVNLHALQMCNIGKSVNHLRTHKNLEIQKKARSLVDTWKKRVEAEMDAKSGSNQTVPWPSRTRLSEVSHTGSKHSVSSEVANRSSVTQLSAPKAGPVKLAQGEATTKSVASPASVKAAVSPVSACTNIKDGQSRNPAVASCGTADPQTNARDEKSSSSSQSHNNSQSYSSDQAKTVGFSGKEDVRSSAAGSATVNKISGSSRHRKSVNGFPGPSVTQRETGSNKSSHRNSGAEKFSQSGLTSDKVVDVAMVEGSNHKLIVKIPNRGRSPAQSASGGSLEDQLVMNSRASSPVPVEKHEQNDRNLKDRNDTYRANVISEVNTESWQSNDFKDVLTGSDEGDGSPACGADEHCRLGEDSRRTMEISKTASSSSLNDLKSSKPKEAPFSSINVLIDSCVKYSETNLSVPVGDDAGMNLLATVAAGEMSKSEMGTPVESPQRNAPVVEYPSTGDDVRLKASYGDDLARDPCQCLEVSNCEHRKQGGSVGTTWNKNGDGSVLYPQEKSTGDLNRNGSSSNLVLSQTADLSLENGRKEDLVAAEVCVSRTAEKASDLSDDKENMAKKAGGGLDDNSSLDSKQQGGTSLLHDGKLIDQCVKTEAEVGRGSLAGPSSNLDMENKKSINGVLDRNLQIHQKSPSNEGDKDATGTGTVEAMISPNASAIKTDVDKERASLIHGSCSEKQKPESETASILKGEYVEENLEVSQVCGQEGGLSSSKVSSTTVPASAEPARSKGSKLTGAEAEDAEERASTATEAPSSVTGGSDMDAKVEFDLNEGFNTDEVKYTESSNYSSTGQLISPLPFPFSSLSSSLPASITIAAAAKKPFVPPDDLLRTKGVLGWKGTAATSAFRPAEPRRSIDTPLGTSNVCLSDASAAKQGKPPLDIDLNVPDERVLEDLSCRGCPQDGISKPDASNNCDSTCGLTGSSPAPSSGGLDLDLNRVDEPIDLGNQAAGNNGRRLDISLQAVRSSSGGILRSEASVRRDFDLNNGPVADEVTTEPLLFSQHSRSSSMPSKAPVSSMRVNGSEMPNLSSWFPSGNPYSAVTVPAFLPDRVEQPFPIVATAGTQRVLGQAAGVTYNPDVYRAPVLPSSPAAPFPSGPFQYPVFPFGATSFPLPSTSFSSGSTTYVDSASSGRLCFPAVHSQLLGPAGAIASSYPRPPYVVSIPEGGNGIGAEGGRKWGRHGLDLNAGPGGPDTEARDEMSRQFPVAGSQVVADEQARIYPFVGGVLKRKEPDGGWDGFKQSSWQ